MLFRNDMDPRCAYCAKGNPISDREVLCPRKGVVASEFSCSRFKYDPLRRIPPRPVKLETSRLKDTDFSI